MKLDIESLLEEARPQVLESLKRELSQQISYDARNALSGEINKLVKQWVEDEIIPEVSKMLIESKDSILSSCVVSAEQIAKLLAESMLVKVKENVESSYKRNNIMEALFK